MPKLKQVTFKVKAKDIKDYVSIAGYSFIPSMFYDGMEFEVTPMIKLDKTPSKDWFYAPVLGYKYHESWIEKVKDEDDLFDF